MIQTENSHTIAPSTEAELCLAIGTLAADAGLSPPLVLKSLKADVRATAHPRRALTNFHRFLLTGFTSAWLRDFQEHKLLQQILLEIFAQSQFLADILVRNTELFRWVTSSNVLKVTKTNQEYVAEASDAIGLFQRLEKKLDSLKRFQRRELLRIGARQILREADVGITSAELSALADSIIGAVLELAYNQISESLQGKPEKELAVIGLGKLGGGELNFSSDIDLMFVYEKDGPLSGLPNRLTSQYEYYSRVAEFVVRRLSEHTAEGHLYRVDMRLRPDGHSGPLAMSRGAYLAYYEARGELWERQMLIKARVVAGDRNVGEGWRQDLQPFVYPKTLLVSPLEEIARIKTKIELNLKDEANIKLGSGGIRDIEFAAQALQLLNGGNNVQVRERNAILALQKLTNSRFLEAKEGCSLESAYRFLRTVEDRLQLLHGLQKHSLPESPEERQILARQLGYGSARAFSRDLESHRSKIRMIFRSVFSIKQPHGAGRFAPQPDLLPDAKRLHRMGFLNASVAQKQIGKVIQEIPELGKPERLGSFLDLVRQRHAPDWCLDNFLRLASSGPIKRATQQAVLSDKALGLLLLLCSRSSTYVGLLSREPLLFEELVGRPEDLLAPGIGWTFLKSADLPRYRVYNEFKTVLRFVVGEISVRELTLELSQLAEDIIVHAFGLARGEEPRESAVPLVLIALGKLGGREISIGSDLDVVLLYKDGPQSCGSKTVQRVGRRLREMLEQVYKVDFRLRPEGKSAPLATEFSYYKEYLRVRASFWERQSLVKARLIAGDGDFMREAMEHVAYVTYHSPLPRHWTREILAMRQRMVRERSKRGADVDLKVGIGGLADLEFLVQALQLRFGAGSAELVQMNTFEAVSALKGRRVLKNREVTKIGKNLEFLRRLEACVRINSETTDFVLPTEKDQLQAVVAAMGASSPKAFRRNLQQTKRENRRLFNTVLKTLLK